MTHDIPYAYERRADTGVSNATLGMWLFIASEVMLFGALFSSYALLRLGAAAWPDQQAVLNVPLAALNTLILLASSVAITRASVLARERDVARLRLWMAMAIAAGVLFLALKVVEYALELRGGLLPSTNNFLGLYFTMTGLHALHVVGGVVVNIYLWGTADSWTRAPQAIASRVRMAALYWNFIDAVWLALFVVFYWM